MSKEFWMLEMFKTIGFSLVLGLSLTACGEGKSSWKEEVLLHDGSKLIVERTQIYGGNHELGQTPIKEQIISFALPNSNQLITWKSEYSADIGSTNFSLLALDIVNSTPYIVADPRSCLSYNKWSRPNPPYIFFKYINQQWKKIPLSEFPVEIKEINMLLSTYGSYYLEEAIKSGFVTSDSVKKFNEDGNMPSKYKSILREPIEKVGCEVMVRYKDGEYEAWSTPESFKELQKSRKLSGSQPVELIKQKKE